MKKIFTILTVVALIAGGFMFSSCKNGEDGEDGASAETLILKQTGNVWWKYNDTTNNTAPTNENESLADIYIKYDTANEKLILAAVGTKSFAKADKGLESGKWAASAVTLKIMGKISKASDPTSGKTELTNFTNWGDFTIDRLIEKLFE